MILDSSYQPPGTGTVMQEASEQMSTLVDEEREIVVKSCLVQVRWLPEA